MEDEHEKSFRRDKVGTARGRKAIDNDEFHNLSSGLGSAKMVEDIRRGLTCLVVSECSARGMATGSVWQCLW